MASWAAWASALPVLEAFEAANALPYRALKAACVPRKPGIRKSKRAHSSSTLFWIGVPLSMSLCCADMRFTACETGLEMSITLFAWNELPTLCPRDGLIQYWPKVRPAYKACT